MKRFLCLLLALVMLMGLCACGKDTDKKDTKSTTKSTTATTIGDTTTTTEGEGTTTEGATTTDGTSATEGSTTGSTAIDTTAVTNPTSTIKTTKPTTPSDTEENAIRVLAIGDDYAVDAVQNHLYQMLKSAGYDTVHLGILYAKNGNLDSLYDAVKADSKTYEFRQNNSGKWTTETKVAASTALKKTDWDVIVLQQSAADSGMPKSYSKLYDLTPLIKKQCADARILWHMTWAYSRGCEIAAFKNYSYNEKNMYNTVVTVALQKAFADENVDGIIPTATTIQNLRTSPLRDSITTAKGDLLSDTYGDYAAALTWYCMLTGESADTVTYRPDSVKSQFAELADATLNAVSAPQEITPSKNEVKDLKILSIGHSFSLDAMREYMWDAFDAAGYNVTIAYLYYPSCSLEQHYHYIKDNSASYEQYGKNVNGEWVTLKNVTAETALFDEDWDIVTFQPDPDYGHGGACRCEWGCGKTIESDYVHFNDLVNLVKSKLASKGNKDVKFYYHLTWTWRKDCYLYNSVSKGYDQQSLWQAFITATDNNVLTNDNILGVIPCNTAIQNARTSWMGDTFNAEGSNDGYHLSDKGDLVAALTWVSYFTGVKAANICLDTTYTAEEFAAFAEAVDNAIAKPREVTQSGYPTKP